MGYVYFNTTATEAQPFPPFFPRQIASFSRVLMMLERQLEPETSPSLGELPSEKRWGVRMDGWLVNSHGFELFTPQGTNISPGYVNSLEGTYMIGLYLWIIYHRSNMLIYIWLFFCFFFNSTLDFLKVFFYPLHPSKSPLNKPPFGNMFLSNHLQQI